jgi:hypothetical protein
MTAPHAIEWSRGYEGQDIVAQEAHLIRFASHVFPTIQPSITRLLNKKTPGALPALHSLPQAFTAGSGLDHAL